MLRHERRSGEALRIYSDAAAATAIGDAVPGNTAATAAFTDDDSAAGDANAHARDSATSTFADTDSAGDFDSAINFNSAPG